MSDKHHDHTPDPISTGKPFGFSAEALKEAEEIFSRYPTDKRPSALLPLLHLAQREHDNWLSREAMDHVAGMVGVAPIRVYEVATFYTMYNKRPVGKYHIQACTNISCMICGSEMVLSALHKKIKIKPGETTEDGRYTLSEVECLGACVNAPMMQINDDYYEHLTPEKVEEIIDRLP